MDAKASAEGGNMEIQPPTLSEIKDVLLALENGEELDDREIWIARECLD